MKQVILGNSDENSVLVKATWMGNRTRVGSVTGITYPRTGNGKLLYVHKKDADDRPDLYEKVELNGSEDIEPTIVVQPANSGVLKTKTIEELRKMTVVEIEKYADSVNLTVPSNLLKSELIDFVYENQSTD